MSDLDSGSLCGALFGLLESGLGFLETACGVRQGFEHVLVVVVAAAFEFGLDAADVVLVACFELADLFLLVLDVAFDIFDG